MTDRAARRLHLLLLAVLTAGVVVILWRRYGFAPLGIVEPPR